MNEDILVPLGAFTMVVALVWVVQRYVSRNRAAFLETVRAAIDKGTDLSPEIIKALGAPKSDKNADIKWGVIWIAPALACPTLGAAIAMTDGDWEIFWILLGVGSFPGFIGLALLGYGLLVDRKDD